MTLVITSGKAALLAAEGYTNNPMIFWENVIQEATASTNNGTEIEPAANAQTPSTYDVWVSDVPGTGTNLLFEFPTAMSATAFAVVGHNVSDLGGTLRLQYNNDGTGTGGWTTVAVVTPSDNTPIMAWFETGTNEFWRVRITNCTGEVEVAAVMLGDAMSIPQRIYQGYAPPIVPNIVQSNSNRTQGGAYVATAYEEKGSEATADITYVEDTFIRGDDFKGFMRHFNQGQPFMWAWRPTKYDTDIFYANRADRAGTVMPQNSGPNALMSFQLGMHFYDKP